MTCVCVECEKKRERCKPVVLHANGEVDYVCPQCAKQLDYHSFFAEVGK